MTEETNQNESIAQEHEHEKEMARKETKNNDYGRIKLVYFALLECAMKYRDVTWPQDMEAYKESIGLYADEQAKKLNGTKQRKLEQRLLASALNYEQKLTNFNKVVNEELTLIRNQFSKATDSFDDYSTRMGLVMEEFVKSKSSGDFLLMCRAFNEGLLDGIIEQMKKADEPPEGITEGTGVEEDTKD